MSRRVRRLARLAPTLRHGLPDPLGPDAPVPDTRTRPGPAPGGRPLRAGRTRLPGAQGPAWMSPRVDEAIGSPCAKSPGGIPGWCPSLTSPAVAAAGPSARRETIR